MSLSWLFKIIDKSLMLSLRVLVQLCRAVQLAQVLEAGP